MGGGVGNKLDIFSKHSLKFKNFPDYFYYQNHRSQDILKILAFYLLVFVVLYENAKSPYWNCELLST